MQTRNLIFFHSYKTSYFSRLGFTLTELLVVLAVIAVVAALLIPMVGRVRDAAQTSKSASNMRQIMNAAALHQAQFGTPVYYRRPIPGHGDLHFFQYFPVLYWDYNFDNLHSPFKPVDWRKVDPDRRHRFPLTAEIEVPLPSYGFNRSGPRMTYAREFGGELGGNIYIRPDTNLMARPERRAYFIESLGMTGATDTADLDARNPPRYAHQGGAAALVGFMDFRVGFVGKDDLLGAEGARWDENDRSYFWTGNPEN